MTLSKPTLLAAILLVTIAGDARGQLDGAGNTDSLRGLKAVKVTVGEIPSAIESKGLSRRDIQTDVELRLRQARIRINENLLPADGWLFVEVLCNDSASNNFVCSYRVRLQQAVTLKRDTTIQTFATTWSSGGMVVGAEVSKVRSLIGDRVAEFANAYLSANPL